MKTEKVTVRLPLDDWLPPDSSVAHQDTTGPDIGFIELLYRALASAFSQMWTLAMKERLEAPCRDVVRECVAQVCLWEQNFPLGSLDMTLHYSGSLQASVLENIRKISEEVIQIFESIPDISSSSTLTNSMKVLETMLEKAVTVLPYVDFSDSSSDESSLSAASVLKDSTNRYGRLQCYVACLMDLSLAIERQMASIQTSLNQRAVPPDADFPLSRNSQPFAILIRDRFNDAESELIERLAQANWERFVRLRTPEEDEDEDEDEDEEFPIFTVEDEILTSIEICSIFHDSGLATSAATSHASYLSILGEDSQGRPRVPPLPTIGRPFQCSYCRRNVCMNNRVEWKIHVFSDLQSYICTHAGCNQNFRMFSKRSDWAKHEQEEHFSQLRWRCLYCLKLSPTQTEYIDHLVSKHEMDPNGSGLRAAVTHSEFKVLLHDFTERRCPLCLKLGWQSARAYMNHVGQHLEEISIASLPIMDKSDASSASEVLTDVSINAQLASHHSLDDTTQPVPSKISEDQPGTGAAPTEPRIGSPREYSSSTSDTSHEKPPPTGSRQSIRSTARKHLCRLRQAVGLRRTTGVPEQPTSSTSKIAPVGPRVSLSSEGDDSSSLDSHLGKLSLTSRSGRVGILVRLSEIVPPESAVGMYAWLDTGCEANLMDMRHWERLVGLQGDRGVLEPTNIDMITLNSERIAVEGIARGLFWHFQNGYRSHSSDFYIIKMDLFDVIIGRKIADEFWSACTWA